MCDILVIRELQLEKLDYCVCETEEFDYLSLILTVPRNLFEVKLSCNVLPPKYFTSITSLSHRRLLNLKRLEISLSDMYNNNELSLCFFGYPPILS